MSNFSTEMKGKHLVWEKDTPDIHHQALWKHNKEKQVTEGSFQDWADKDIFFPCVLQFIQRQESNEKTKVVISI